MGELRFARNVERNGDIHSTAASCTHAAGNIKHGWAYVLLGCAVVIGLSYLFADSLGSSGQSNDSALVSVSEVKGEILTYGA